MPKPEEMTITAAMHCWTTEDPALRGSVYALLLEKQGSFRNLAEQNEVNSHIGDVDAFCARMHRAADVHAAAAMLLKAFSAEGPDGPKGDCWRLMERVELLADENQKLHGQVVSLRARAALLEDDLDQLRALHGPEQG